MTAQSTTQSQETSESTKTIITILLLLFLTPIGLILMWFWTKWKVWVKIVITLIPITLALLGLFATIFLVALNPQAKLRQAECTQKCESSLDRKACFSECVTNTLQPTIEMQSEITN